MARRNITKETQKAFDEAIMDLMSGRYTDAVQKYESVSEELEGRIDDPRHGDHFRPYYWVSGLGLGLAEEMAAKIQPEAENVSDLAQKAHAFYNNFVAIYTHGTNVRHDTMRNLGKSYASLGYEKAGIRLLEQLRRPRIRDTSSLLVQKARKLAEARNETANNYNLMTEE